MKYSALDPFQPNGDEELQHTLDHIDCPACEATRLELNRTTDVKKLKFRDAAELRLMEEHFYLQPENALLVVEDKSLRVGARTYRDHCDFARRLNVFFGGIPVEMIHEGHWHQYQKRRLKTAGSGVVNHELSFLKRILERAGAWDAIKSKCHTLHVGKSTVGRALTPPEERIILTAAATRRRWELFYLCALLMRNTTCNQGEAVHLRIKDLDMKARLFWIREGGGQLREQPDGSFRHAPKTSRRERELPMNDTVVWVFTRLLKRYKNLCKRLAIEPSPEHYLFAGRRRGGKADPTRHLGSFKRAWAGICAQAGLAARGIDVTRDVETLVAEWAQICKADNIKNPRIEDFRHTASTELQSNDEISTGIVEDLMGHKQGSDTKDEYRHSHAAAMLEALKKIEVKPVKVEKPDNLVELFPCAPRRRIQ